MSIPVRPDSTTLWHFADLVSNNELMMLLAYLGQRNEDEVLARLPRVSYEILDDGARERLVCAHFFLIMQGQGAEAAIEFLRRILRLGQPRLRYGLKAHIRVYYPELEPFSTFAATEVDGMKHVSRRHQYWRKLQANPMPELERYLKGLQMNARREDVAWIQAEVQRLRAMYPSIPDVATAPFVPRVREVVVSQDVSRDTPVVSSDAEATALIDDRELDWLRRHYEARSGYPNNITRLCNLLLDQPCVTLTDRIGRVWAYLIRGEFAQAKSLARGLRREHPESIHAERLVWYANRPNPERDRGMIIDRFQGTVRKVTLSVPEPKPTRVPTGKAKTRLEGMIADPATRDAARLELLEMSASDRMGEWAAILLMEILIDDGDFGGANQVFERHRGSFTSKTFHRFGEIFRERMAIRMHGPRRKRSTFFDNAGALRPVNGAASNELRGVEHRQPGDTKTRTRRKKSAS